MTRRSTPTTPFVAFADGSRWVRVETFTSPWELMYDGIGMAWSEGECLVTVDNALKFCRRELLDGDGSYAAVVETLERFQRTPDSELEVGP